LPSKQNLRRQALRKTALKTELEMLKTMMSTGWTVWPDQRPPRIRPCREERVAPNQVSESVAVFLLLRELEASLQRSIRAILLMDAAVLEGETRQQIGLMRAISVATPRTDPGLLANGRTESAKMELDGREWADPELLDKVRQGRGRIIEAVRLQAALLSRARGKLQVLANMLSGPSVLYGPTGRPSACGRV